MAAAVTFRAVLHHKEFRLLLGAHGVGTVAQLMTTVALGIEVLARTSSSVGASVTVALGFAPYVVCSGVSGVIADRWSRSAVLTGSFLARTGCAAVVAAGLLWSWPVPLLIAVSAIAAVLATPAYPALAAATPQCVPDEQLTAANALVTGVENATWIAGPGVLGLVLLAGHGPTVATAVGAALFAVAAGLAARVRLPRPARAAEPAGVLADLLDGVRAVARRPRVRRPMMVAVVDNFLYGYLVVAVVLLGERGFGGSDAVGWLNAGLSAGALLAMVVVNRLAAHARPGLLLRAVLSGFAVAVAVIGIAGLVGSLPVAVVWITAAGAGTLVAEVVAVTLLQRAAPADVTARVFGVYDQLNVGAIAVGSLLAGPLADVLGSASAMLVVAGCCLVAGLLAARGLDGRPRHARRRREAPWAPAERVGAVRA